MSSWYVPGTGECLIYIITFNLPVFGGRCYELQFRDKPTEAQRGTAACLESLSSSMTEREPTWACMPSRRPPLTS